MIEHHFVRKGSRDDLQFYLRFGDRTSFRAKVFADDLQIAILPQFLAIEPHFVQKGLRWEPGNRNFTSVFGDRTSFRAKGFAGRLAILPQIWRSNLISCERVARDKLKSQFYFSFW